MKWPVIKLISTRPGIHTSEVRGVLPGENVQKSAHSLLALGTVRGRIRRYICICTLKIIIARIQKRANKN